MSKGKAYINKIAPGSGALACIEDYAECRIEENRLELEAAMESAEIWRLQGRIMELRELLHIIKCKKDGEIL